MKRLAFAILLVVAVAAFVFLALNRPSAEASPDVTITVNSSGDTVAKDDDVLTLREAILLATGDRLLSQLSRDECGQVSGASWKFPFGPCEADKYSPGATSADTVRFDATVFPSGFSVSITLGDTLPALHTGDDTVDASAAGVILEGGGTDPTDFDCFDITSNNNTIRGLEIRNCNRAVHVGGGAQDNTIGGSTTAGQCSGDCNVISGNEVGVGISGSGTTNNTIKGNYIGTNAAGDAALPNHIGVNIWNFAHNNTIGGSSPDERNLISGGTFGVLIRDGGTNGNVVKGNYIGTDADGTAALPNNVGVAIGYGAQSNTIGGSEAHRNVISGNDAAVAIELPGTNSNVVKGNLIGTDAAGEDPIPNGLGVAIANGAQNNTIGGTAGGEPNLIAFNNENGVRVDGADTTGNTIRGNYIHHNGEKGIENQDGGNEELEPPTITGFGSVMGTACPNCFIDIYSDDEDEGGGYGGWTTADDDGNWTFLGSPEGPNVTATATDSDGNTSEFSDPVAVSDATPIATVTATATATATATSTATATASPTPPATPTRTLAWEPAWHNATWTGPDATSPQDAFSCADAKYAAAYRYVDSGLERFFPGRPDISNMNPLGQYAAFLILITEPVTCQMPLADPPGAQRTLNWAAGWHNDAWTGPDATSPQTAFDCANGDYAAAYRHVAGAFERYFPGRPDISNMNDLGQYDPFLILLTDPVTCTMAIAP